MTSLSWLYLPTAFLLGIAHALEPGHSKAIVASYLISVRGTVKDAVALGVVTTIAHTCVILLLAAGVLALGNAFPIERLQHGLEAGSGAIVFVMGLWLLRSRWHHWREHHHPDANGHSTHSHQPLAEGQRLNLKSLVSLGLSGGLVPCPAALALFILSVGIGQPFLGLVTVIVFSIGLAITLIIIGIVVCRGYALVEAKTNAKWMNLIPFISAITVTLFGLWMFVRGMMGTGQIQMQSPVKESL